MLHNPSPPCMVESQHLVQTQAMQMCPQVSLFYAVSTSARKQHLQKCSSGQCADINFDLLKQIIVHGVFFAAVVLIIAAFIRV